jgi:hypothetical protein
VGGWWQRDVVEAGKLPLMLCFLAFVLTFLTTRGITRLIRAGVGPFRNRVTADGTHVHHAVPGLALLIVGAFTAVGTSTPGWTRTSAVMIGIGVSLVLDEFALILHLTDVYWSNEGLLSVDLVSLAAACLALALIGFSPVGVDDVGGTEMAVRVGTSAVLILHGVAVLSCVLKGKYSTALIGLFLPPIAFAGAIRLARPGSVVARHRYGAARAARAGDRAEEFDRRYDPVLRRWQDFIGGTPSLPDPTPQREQ